MSDAQLRGNGTSRRQFLAASAIGSAGLLVPNHTPAQAQQVAPKANDDAFLQEYGFWDYTTPAAGGMEAYELDDYISLFDDMAGAGMNSVLILVKWLTTGYRSRLRYLDQDENNPVTRSNNELLRQAIDEAHKRGIKVWIGAVVTHFVAEEFGGEPYATFTRVYNYRMPKPVGVYDVDHPGVTERSIEMFEEIIEQFPKADGLLVEVENAAISRPHRIPLYNAWAEANGRRAFEQLGKPLNARSFDVPEWRDYTTHARIQLLKAIEKSVRAKGFEGEMSTICETLAPQYAVFQEVNLAEYHKACPDWVTTTYEYDKSNHRYAMMDFCIDHPKKEGLKVYYLPRGVMTWGPTPLPVPLEKSWEMDVEDILTFKPHGVWWFGSGTENDGVHVAQTALKNYGFENGVAARRALLKKTAALRVGR